MKKVFKISYIYCSEEDDYYIMGFSDKELNFTEYIMIQLAYEFDEEDVESGMDGEYFEYGNTKNSDASYKCVDKVILTPKNITFSLNSKIENYTEYQLEFENLIFTEIMLEYLQILFADKLVIIK